MAIPKTYLWSVDPGSRELFELECGAAADVELLEQLDERSYLVSSVESFKPFFGLHRFEVQKQTLLPLDLQEIGSELPAMEVPSGIPYAFQLRANLRLPWNFREIAEGWESSLGLDQQLRSNRKPQVVVSGFFQAGSQEVRCLAGVSPIAHNLSPWSGGMCRIPVSTDSVSRAEQKLEEAWELFSLSDPTFSVPAQAVALDLGAAPGGWSRLAAEWGYEVHAVDPAALHERVVKNPRITHYPTTAGDFLNGVDRNYDLLLCDMKMEAALAGRLVLQFAPHLKSGARLVLTLKLPKKGKIAGLACEVVAMLQGEFDVVAARQLYFNRSEITVLARKRPEV